MLIPDLYEFPAGHPPTPYGNHPWLDGASGWKPLPRGSVLRAVGWLGEAVPRVGETPPECIEKLVQALEACHVFPDFTRGWHDCEVCPSPEGGRSVDHRVPWRGRHLDFDGRGHLLVLDKPRLWRRRVLYMCPELLPHYIVAHAYRPPEEFVRAVLEGRVLDPRDLMDEELWGMS